MQVQTEDSGGLMLKQGFVATVLAQLCGRVGSILASMMMLTLAARYLDQTAFGEVMYTLTFINIFIQLADFGTNSALSALLVSNQAQRSTFWGNFLIIRLQLICVSMLTSLAAALVFGKLSPIMLLIAMATIPLGGSRFFDAVYQVYGKPWLSTWTLAAYSVTLLVLTWGVVWLQVSKVGFLVAYAVANGVYCTIALQATFSCLRPKWARNLLLRKQIWNIALPIGISALFTVINSRASVFVIEHYRDFGEVGIYTAATRVLELGVSIAAMALGPLVPIFSRCAQDRGQLKRAYLEILKWVLIAVVPLVLSGPLWSATLIQLLYGPKYFAAAPAVSVLSGVGGLVMLCLLNSYVLLSLGQVRFGIWLSGGAALLSVSLNLWLVPNQGFMAAVWIALLVEALMCAMTFVLLYTELGQVIEGRTLFRLSTAAALSLLVMYGGWTNLPWLALGAGIFVYVAVANFNGLLCLNRAHLHIFHSADTET
jgi:O-antigen/teichoic acid export membrane protein